MSIEIVFFDIDGTLIDENKKTAKKTLQAIEQLKEKGIQVVFSTGRSPRHIVDVQKMFQIDSYICFNGAFGFHQGETIFNHQLNLETLTKLMDDIKIKNHPIVYLNDEGCYASVEQDKRIATTFERLKEKQPSFQPTIWKDKPIYQAYLYCLPEEQKVYEESHPEIKFTRWHPYAVDINSYNMNKSIGVKSFLQHVQIDPKNAAAFGDHLNDLEMLQYVGYGIAMGDAIQEAKDRADFVTKPLKEDGIYYGLKHLGLIE